MHCESVLERLEDLVDAELQGSERDQVRAHLDVCRTCNARYRESIELKRLIARRAYQPTIPGGLAARILGRPGAAVGTSPASGGMFGTVVTALAASVLALTIGAMLLSVVLPPEAPLAHAEVVKAVAGKYSKLPPDAFRPSPVDGGRIPANRVEETLGVIRRRTGVRLSSLPAIDKARPVSWRPDELLGRPCVSIAYEDVTATESPAGERPRILIYAVPVHQTLQDPHSYCNCVVIEGANIFCFRYAEASMNLVTSLPREDMQERLREIIR